MVSSDGRQASAEPRIPLEVKAEALDVIRDVLQWQVTEARWLTIGQILADMEAAYQTDDREGPEAAMVHLELTGPLRLSRIGVTPIVPTPRSICDRLNGLVFALDGTRPAPQRQASEGGEIGSDDSRRS